MFIYYDVEIKRYLDPRACLKNALVSYYYLSVSFFSSYFMPHSVECDKYSVLGKIINVMEMQNSRTKEIFYYLSVECNSIQIEFTIAKEDLMGEPKVGRRFKGILWLQGEVDCL